ncbi:MAG: hypothetical protein MI922_09395 [Bacteroidales bacterium]|nr:hypothetical protein [Bacteroidales bacterium]
MMRSNVSRIALLAAIGVTCLFSSCEKEQVLIDEPDAAVTNYIPSNFDIYTITQSGTYIISGTVTGKYIRVEAPDVTIKGEGANPTFQGLPYSGEARSASHIRGGRNSLTVKNFTFIGKAGHNFMSVGSDNTLIENLTVINNTKDGAGAINPGPNSMVRGCYIEPHDDAIKITEPNSRAENNDVVMDGNGSVIQLGWGLRSDGAIHYADDIRISGYLINNKQTDVCNNPGRAIIGGIFEAPKPGEENCSDLQLTNLDINMSSQHDGHYVKLRADGGSLTDVIIQGVIHNDVNVSPDITPVALSTNNGGVIENITIDFGSKISMNEVYADAGVINLTIGSGSSCDNDPAPTGSILTANLNASGYGRVKVSASDNQGVSKVELYKGTQLLDVLTTPNVAPDYRFITPELTSGDDFTVIIYDECNNTKTLNGTIDGGTSDPCASDPAPTGSIIKTDYNLSGHGRVKIAASDNSAVVSVEVFKGTTSMGLLTEPNVAPDYRIVNDDLNPGDSFTVVITDDCNNTTTLAGTMP